MCHQLDASFLLLTFLIVAYWPFFFHSLRPMPVLNFSRPLSHSWHKATSRNPSTTVPVALPQRLTGSILQSFIEMTSNLGHRLRVHILSRSGVAINQLAINYRCTAMLLVCFASFAIFSHPCISFFASIHQQ